MTEYNREELEFHGFGRRTVVAKFDGGMISFYAGGLSLREVEERTGIIHRLAQQFIDHRDPGAIELNVDAIRYWRCWSAKPTQVAAIA